VIKYIGSKRTLIPNIMAVTAAVQPTGSVIDLFSGTSRVGHALKSKGYRVFANDHNAYAETIARCYVAADKQEHERDALRLIQEFNGLPGRAGYFTDVFCERSWFFQPKNGARVDAIREEIERKEVSPELKAILLVSLMEAADRVDSTTGVQMAYLKQWAARAHNDLELRLPEVLPRARAGKGEAWRLDAEEAVDRLEADICYLDPPYNQHKYLGNYHIWESLVLWDKPEVYGIACKRVDCRERGSAFNSKPNARVALDAVIAKSKAKHLIVSFNNEGYFSRADIETMLSCRGEVVLFAHDFKRYVGAQIGIHNLKGQRVGEVSHLRNTEYIYVATNDRAVVERLRVIGGRFGHELDDEPTQTRLLRNEPATVTSPQALNITAAKEPGQRMAALIRERGSIYSSEAEAETGPDPGAIRAAVRALAAANIVHVASAGRGVRYEVNEGAESAVPVHRLPTRPSLQIPPLELRTRLVAFLSSCVDASSEELQRVVDADALTLRLVLRHLSSEGVVATTGQRRGTRYRFVMPTPSVTPSEPAARPNLEPTTMSISHGAAPGQQLSIFDVPAS
jgi:adenine-specific DNA-methyltransferase